MAVALPDVLPRLPDVYADVCTLEMQQGIHSSMKDSHKARVISTTGLHMIGRLLNRFAHALLLSIVLNADGEQPHEVMFPECAGMIQLHHHGKTMVDRQLNRHRSSRTPSHSSFISLQSQIARWIEEFRQCHPAAVTLNVTEENRVMITAWVDYMTAELLEISNSTCCGRSDWSVIESVDVVRGVERDEELRPLVAYLGATCTYIDALRERFAPHRSLWQTYDRTYGWYHDDATTKRYAQQYARGELLPGDAYFFRQHGIRPLQFFGKHRSLDRALCRRFADGEEEDDFYKAETPSSRGSVVFSFELRDAHDRWMPLICELRESRGCARFYTANKGDLVASVSCASKEDTPRCTIQWSEALVAAHFGGGVSSEPSNVSHIVNTNHKRQRLLDQHQTSAISSIFQVPDAVSHSKSFQGIRPFVRRAKGVSIQNIKDKRKVYKAKLKALEAKLRQEIDDERPSAILEDKLLVAAQLAHLHRFGPQLFGENHPPAVRVYFTATLVDVVSTQNGLPILPTVLLHMIGEYAPVADLPYVPPQDSSTEACFTDQLVPTPFESNDNADDEDDPFNELGDEEEEEEASSSDIGDSESD
jgi:hypothetical protein